MHFPFISLGNEAAIRLEEEAHVIVQVRWNALALRNGMDVEIERARSHEIERRETGLLRDFAARHGPEVRISIRMSAGLEPAAESFVMDQQELPALAIDHECRRGEVTREIGSLEAVRMVVDERGEDPELLAVALLEKDRGREDVQNLAAGIRHGSRARPVSIHSAQSGRPLLRARAAASFHGYGTIICSISQPWEPRVSRAYRA